MHNTLCGYFRALLRTFEVDDVQSMDITSLEQLEIQLCSHAPHHAKRDDSAVHDATQTATPSVDEITKHNIPTWTPNNSLLASEKLVTKVAHCLW